MRVTIHSIQASSDCPGHFTVAASLDGDENEFEFHVSEEPIHVASGDQNFEWRFLDDLSKTGDIGRLVLQTYHGKVLRYPIVLDG